MGGVGGWEGDQSLGKEGRGGGGQPGCFAGPILDDWS